MAKLVRVANQLKVFEVGKPSGFASPVGKDPPSVVDAESKIQENRTNQGKVKLSQIFQRSKMRRLNGATQSDPVSPEQKHADGISAHQWFQTMFFVLAVAVLIFMFKYTLMGTLSNRLPPHFVIEKIQRVSMANLTSLNHFFRCEKQKLGEFIGNQV